MAVLYSGENASVLYSSENASGPSKRGNSGGLASAPWPARHNDPSQGRSSDLQLNRRGGGALSQLHIHPTSAH